MLTKEAFNALLKTLEEPPEHVVFIMATTDAIKVPVTITSRAQTYTFKLATYETMFNFLKSVTEKDQLSAQSVFRCCRRYSTSVDDSC
jgi:DNA polymerase-3 subunit gamma/tau